MFLAERVPEDHEASNVFLQLREISDIILAPVIDSSWLPYLDHIVGCFIADFNKVFPGRVIPKMHYMLHYGRLMNLFGPLKHLWCMRFESKHQFFKQLAPVVRNFKNISYTLAKRHQMRKCAQLSTPIPSEPEQQSVGSAFSFASLPPALQNHLQVKTGAGPADPAYRVPELKYRGVVYRNGLAYITDIRGALEEPVFLVLKFILKLRNTWLMCGKVLYTKYFDTHLHGYVVNETEEWNSIWPSGELDYSPLDVYKTDCGKTVIIMRHRVCTPKQAQ